jgi:hypothetical protein
VRALKASQAAPRITSAGNPPGPGSFQQKRGEEGSVPRADRGRSQRRLPQCERYGVRTSTESSHPEHRATEDRVRPSPVGRVGTKRFPRASPRGCIARIGRLVLRHSDIRNGWRDQSPTRCIPRSRGAASRNRELGHAPSEAREGPAASNTDPSPPSQRPLPPRFITRRRGGDPRPAPRGGDPRYTRWAANRRRDGSFRCRE